MFPDTFPPGNRQYVVVDVSIIISCYNGAGLIEPRVREFEAVLRSTHWSWEILVCDDGSTDGTAVLCKRLAARASSCRFFRNPVNRGRGRTVRDAIPEARGRLVGYVDVDGSTSASYLVPILVALEDGYEVAEANRTYHLPLSALPFILHRYIAHKLYAWLVRIFLGISGHDTETGFKFFRKEALDRLRSITYSAGWFWDTEIVANAHQLGFDVAEIRSPFFRTPKMPTTVHLLRDGSAQFLRLLGYAFRTWSCSLRGPCCTPASTSPRTEKPRLPTSQGAPAND